MTRISLEANTHQERTSKKIETAKGGSAESAATAATGATDEKAATAQRNSCESVFAAIMVQQSTAQTQLYACAHNIAAAVAALTQ